jgi:hypothetical protein
LPRQRRLLRVHALGVEHACFLERLAQRRNVESDGRKLIEFRFVEGCSQHARGRVEMSFEIQPRVFLVNLAAGEDVRATQTSDSPWRLSRKTSSPAGPSRSITTLAAARTGRSDDSLSISIRQG